MQGERMLTQTRARERTEMSPRTIVIWQVPVTVTGVLFTLRTEQAAEVSMTKPCALANAESRIV